MTQCVKFCLGKTAGDTYKFCGAGLTESVNYLVSVYSLNPNANNPPPQPATP